MQDRAQIRDAHWQMQRDPDGAVLGEIASGYADLDQEIRQCILTPKRSVPLNPTKGCDLEQFRDRPTNVQYLLAAAEVRQALTLWCPRIIVERIETLPAIDSLTISVFWTPTEAVAAELRKTEVTYAY